MIIIKRKKKENPACLCNVVRLFLCASRSSSSLSPGSWKFFSADSRVYMPCNNMTTGRAQVGRWWRDEERNVDPHFRLAAVPNGRDYAVRHPPPPPLILSPTDCWDCRTNNSQRRVFFFVSLFLTCRAEMHVGFSLLFCSARSITDLTITAYVYLQRGKKMSGLALFFLAVILGIPSFSHSLPAAAGNSLQGCNHLLQCVRCSQISSKHQRKARRK